AARSCPRGPARRLGEEAAPLLRRGELARDRVPVPGAGDDPVHGIAERARDEEPERRQRGPLPAEAADGPEHGARAAVEAPLVLVVERPLARVLRERWEVPSRCLALERRV